MVSLRLRAFLALLIFSLSLSQPAWSQNPPDRQEEAISFPKQTPQAEESAKEQDIFSSPLKPDGNQKYLLLDPDGSPSGCERFLAPLEELDKQPKR
jgi:hypothetical protein